MFERFSDSARHVVVHAQDEARLLRHNYLGTEHILLGVLREEKSLAAQVLGSLDVTLEEVRAQVARIVGQGDEVTTGQIPFTPRAKKVLELALREAVSLGHGQVGAEHVLLGLVREKQGVAMRILLHLDADARTVAQTVSELGAGTESEEYIEAFGGEVPARDRVFGRVDALGPRRLPALVTGWLLFAVALGVGLLLGWAIWG